MKKILFYLPFIKIGGLERVAIEYIKGLIEKGYKVDLIVDFNLGKLGNTFEYAIPKEVNFQYLKSEKTSKAIYLLRTLGKKYKIFNLFLYVLIILLDFFYFHLKAKKIIENGEYDFTISFYQFSPSYLTRNKATKHIIWLHGSVEHFFTSFSNIFLKIYGNKIIKYDYVVTIADEMKQQLERIYPNLPKNKVKMIYNPFDFDEIENKSNDYNSLNENCKKLIEEDFICTVSRIDENQKDITTLILAYNILYKDKKIKEKLYIIGEGLSMDYLTNIVNQNKLQDQVLFLGKKLNPFVWIKKSKIFVLSSKFEGLPTVLIESLAVNTFTISSNCKTGPLEILHNGECGELFETGNIDQLASLINKALLNKDYRDSKINKGKERIKEFDRKSSLNQLTNLIEN